MRITQGTMMQPYKVTSCAYADDLATINDDADGVQNSINIIYAFCKKWRLTINCKKGKTEVLIMYASSDAIIQQHWITPTGEIIHRTSQYTYLGMILCENGSMKQYVEHRTQSSINTMGSLYDSQLLRPGVSLECRLLPFKTLVLPIMTHACETLFYGTDMTFVKMNEFIEKRNHNCIRQLLHCRNNRSAIDWMMAETGLRPIFYYTSVLVFSFYARMSSANNTIPAFQVYDRMWQMNKYMSEVQPNRTYHSSYVQQITRLAEHFNINLYENKNNWVSDMKRNMKQHWHNAWLESMTENTSTWRQVYLHIKQTPTTEAHVNTLTHMAAHSIHKLRGHHYPFQEFIASMSQAASATCKLCQSHDNEDQAHFLLHCAAYTHRTSLTKQTEEIIQHSNEIVQQAVTKYFDNTHSSIIQCARLLSRTTPPKPQNQDRPAWLSMWQKIFAHLDDHIYIMVSQRDKQLSLIDKQTSTV
jgi:hypothetical protein